MHVNNLLQSDSHMGLVVENQADVTRLVNVISQSQGHVGLISDRLAPLLSNLDLEENITLPLLYHKNISQNAALRRMRPFFQFLGMTPCLQQRKEELNRREILAGYLLRAQASENRAVYVDWPRVWEVDFLLDCLRNMGTKMQLWVPVEEVGTENLEKRGFALFRMKQS